LREAIRISSRRGFDTKSSGIPC